MIILSEDTGVDESIGEIHYHYPNTHYHNILKNHSKKHYETTMTCKTVDEYINDYLHITFNDKRKR